MSPTGTTPRGIAYDRAGPRGRLPVLLIHAGVADRRMWDPVWTGLTAGRDVIRLDLRGYGRSVSPPDTTLRPVDDVLETLALLDVGRCHVIGASYGAGVSVELALARPEAVASLLLVAPGGSLIATATDDLRAFFAAERDALAAGDVDLAVEANLAAWVDGPTRRPDAVDPAVREDVGRMQRLAFDITASWGGVDEQELDPPALEQLSAVRSPTLVLVGALDLDAVLDAARQVVEGIDGARLVEWQDVAHLPSLERPGAFVTLVHEWLEGRDAS